MLEFSFRANGSAGPANLNKCSNNENCILFSKETKNNIKAETDLVDLNLIMSQVSCGIIAGGNQSKTILQLLLHGHRPYLKIKL
jgi:hypothetical protein